MWVMMIFNKVSLDFNPRSETDDVNDTDQAVDSTKGSLDAVLKNLKRMGSETIDPLTKSHADLVSVQNKIKHAFLRMPSRVNKREMQANRIIFKEPRKRKIVCVTLLHISTGHETLVISSSEDKRVAVWALSTAGKIVELAGHREKISSMTTFYSENHEPVLITGSWDESVRIWPLMSLFKESPVAEDIEAQCLDLCGHTNRVNQVITVHREGCEPYIASAASDGSIRIWSLGGATLMVLEDKRVETFPLCVAAHLTGDSAVLVAGCKDNYVRVWNLLDHKEPPRLIAGHQSKVKNIAVFDSAKEMPVIATVCRDFLIRLFDLTTGAFVASLAGNTCPITSISVTRHKTGPVLASGNCHGTLRLWSCLTHELLRVFYGHRDVCTCVSLLPLPASDCLLLFSSSEDCTTRAWHYTEERSLAVLKHENKVRVNTVASLLVDDKVIVFTGTEKGEVLAWAPSPKSEFGTVLWKKTVHTDYIRHLVVYRPAAALPGRSGACLPPAAEIKMPLDKPLLISVGRDSRICFSSIRGEKMKAEIDGHDTVITCLAVFDGYVPPPRERMAGSQEVLPFLASGGEDNDVLVWSIERAELLFRLEGHDFDVTALAIFESQQQKEEQEQVKAGAAGLSQAPSRRASLNLLREQVRLVKSKAPPLCVDDPWIVSGSMDSTVRVWSVRSRKCIHVYRKNESHINAVAAKELSTGAIVAAGCEDSTIYVWQLGKDFQLLFTLLGHRDEIQSLVLYQAATLEPVLVSGSWDLTINVWSLKTRSVIKTFEGHTREITQVVVCATDGDPALLSASSDSTVRVEFDFLSKLPKLDAIERAFRFDLGSLNSQVFKSSSHWPRLSKLVHQMGAETFFGNFHFLFRAALEEDRPDFLVKFLPKTRRGLIESNKPQQRATKASLLGLALEKENKTAVKVIMSCFSSLLTSQNPKDYDEIFYHENAQVSMTDLVCLSATYPNIFQDFIVRLILVPVKEATIPANSLFLYHDRNKKILIRRHNGKQFFTKRGNQVQAIDSVPQPPPHPHPPSSRIPKKAKQLKAEERFMFIPMQNPVHMEMLRAMADVCRELDSVDIFDSDYGQLALRFAWKSFGKKEHVKQMCLYLLYVVLATFSVYSFDRLLESDIWVLAFVVIGLQLLLDLYFFKIEVQQMASNSFSHLHDIWNLLDIVVIASGLVGNASRISYRYETLQSRVALSIQSICMWFNILFYLRAFENTGPLVSMILRIANDMQSLIFVLLVVIVGFSQAFWLLSSGFGKDDLPFATVGNSFLNSFSFMLGNFDPQGFEGLPLERFAVLLSTFFMLLVSLLLLNLLIALMGDSYADVREKGQAQWRLEQVNLIIESASNMAEADLTRTDQIYFRKLEDDERAGADLIEQTYTLDERMAALEGKLDGVLEVLTQAVAARGEAAAATKMGLS